MSLQNSPYFDIKWGWILGSDGWNVGMDENLLVLSFLNKHSVNSFVDTLPTNPVHGDSHIYNTDGKAYFRVNDSWLFVGLEDGYEFSTLADNKKWKVTTAGFVEIPTTATLSTNLNTVTSDLNALTLRTTQAETDINTVETTVAGIQSDASTLPVTAETVTQSLSSWMSYALDRANHKSTQLSNTISDFAESVEDVVANALKSNTASVVYDDVANTITLTNKNDVGSLVPISAGVLDLSAVTGCVTVELTQNITSILLPAGTVGITKHIEIDFEQDAIGGWTVAGWPVMEWLKGITPAVSGTADTTTKIILTNISSRGWVGYGLDSAGDTGLRQDLADPAQGAALVTLPNGSTVAALQSAGGSRLISGNATVVNSITELRALSATDKASSAVVLGYYAAADGGGGVYYRTSDTTSVDNGGSLIVATDNARWKLASTSVLSVRQFGAKGDGVADDAPAIQKAIDALPASGGSLFFPAGNYLLGTTVNLRNISMDVYGEGQSSRVFGSINPLIAYPASVTNASGVVVAQDIHDLTIDATADNIGVQLHQTWDGAGKVGPNIYRNFFLNSSSLTTTAVGISVSGIWTAKIFGNYFSGKGAGGAPTDGKGGYGIKVVLTADMNSSVMNVNIINNIFVTVAYPIHVPDRAASTGGRVEGIKIIGNNLIAGNVAMRFAQTLAVTVTGNQLSDYDVGIMSVGDFDMCITGNAEITGKTSGINILAAAFSIAERISISGNRITCGDAGRAIRLSNTVANDYIRRISIANNVLSGAGKTDSVGVALEGSFRATAVTIGDNVFSTLTSGMFFSGTGHIGIKYTGNTYDDVTNKIADPVNTNTLVDKFYSSSNVLTLTGGATTETINIAVPAGLFSEKPTSAFATAPTEQLVGIYDYDTSTITNLVFVVVKIDSTVLASGSRRFGVSATGKGYSQE